MLNNDRLTTYWARGAALAGMALITGCASLNSGVSGLMGSGTGVTATDPTRLTQSGFLSDYARLKPTPWGEGIQCWADPRLDAKRYDKVLIAPMVVTLKPGRNQAVDPADLKILTDYFHASLATALKPQLQVVNQPGRGVVVLRIALTNLVPTGITRSLTGTLVPYGFVAEAGSGVATGRPAGSTPYLGETGMEMQFRDGGSGAVLAECRDTQIGRKYAADLNAGVTGAAQTWASGYVNSFQSWAYARNAFDKWSTLTANRIAELRGATPTR
ncbi:DUF3313 domain-containing protein [uncultured Lamprocystis sp.]|jgi:hypothetical protein|uniref:DUF3313 domain-containing protein n=1 Tax=uncultured Lamprocystis sp. TaxID=543132 RepID=UPI0025D34576|nr:DUF3313 domain-containing protein [uncultured Lamprocystis sp.]